MSYVRKLMAPDEKLIGIARLHWIYIVKGVFWFCLLTGLGWLFNSLMTRALYSMGSAINNAAIPGMLVGFNNGVMYFMMGAGFLIFLFLVIDVFATEIGLSDRRVMHKKNLLFIKVHQIDLEEIRGENIDLGWFGRILGYGYVLLDCRFIGDVRLPAIENPERFMRALHDVRGKTQDSLNVVVGKGKAPYNLKVVDEGMQDPQPKAPEPEPEIKPSEQPQPEVQPDHQPDEMPTRPTPHAPPSSPQPPAQPNVPPQPQQPVPNPGPNPQPPLQPPASPVGGVDPQTVAAVVAQVTPQIAQNVVEQLKVQGMLKEGDHEAATEDDIDKDLIADFDEARFQDEDPHERFNKLEHAIH